MVQVNSKSKDAKVLRVILERYPIDDKEIAERAGLGKDETRRILIAFEQRGWVSLERLPDKMFIRMKRFDFTFAYRTWVCLSANVLITLGAYRVT